MLKSKHTCCKEEQILDLKNEVKLLKSENKQLKDEVLKLNNLIKNIKNLLIVKIDQAKKQLKRSS
jgi:hypothetical protein